MTSASDPRSPLGEAIFDALSTRGDLVKRAKEPSGQTRPAFGDLYKLANTPGLEAPEGLADALRSDLSLRRTFNTLLGRNSLYFMPRAAAASTGEISKRDCKGASLVLKQSRANAGQVYLVITLEDFKAAPPGELVCTGDNGLERLALEAPFDGVIQMMLEESSALVQSLRTPSTEIFLR